MDRTFLNNHFTFHPKTYLSAKSTAFLIKMKTNGLSSILFCGLLSNQNTKCLNKIQTMKEAQFKSRLNAKINRLNRGFDKFQKLPYSSLNNLFIKTGAASGKKKYRPKMKNTLASCLKMLSTQFQEFL